MKKQEIAPNRLHQWKRLFAPYGYELDDTLARPFFWRKVQQNDLRSPYAFSLVLITLHPHTITIEGLNEPRLQRAIRAGHIEINSEEEVDALKELVFETDLENFRKIEVVLPFFEQQLQTIERDPIHTDDYKRALANIALLVEAAQELE